MIKVDNVKPIHVTEESGSIHGHLTIFQFKTEVKPFISKRTKQIYCHDYVMLMQVQLIMVPFQRDIGPLLNKLKTVDTSIIGDGIYVQSGEVGQFLDKPCTVERLQAVYINLGLRDDNMPGKKLPRTCLSFYLQQNLPRGEYIITICRNMVIVSCEDTYCVAIFY